MAKLDIITLPDPLLRTVSTPIETVDDHLRRLIDDMFDGGERDARSRSAGSQDRRLRRNLVLDVGGDEPEDRRPLTMINPEIVRLSDTRRVYEEGCLSIPDIKVEIERPNGVTVRFLDRDGHQQELTADGLLATAIQHELDHLDGRMIIDFLSRLRREMIVRKMRKLARA